MKQLKSYSTISQMARDNQAMGHHWFDDDTKRFFKARIGETIYGPSVFTSSTQGPGLPRQYQIDICANGKVDGLIREIGTLSWAKSHAKKLGDLVSRFNRPDVNEMFAWSEIVKLQDGPMREAVFPLLDALEVGTEFHATFTGRRLGAIGEVGQHSERIRIVDFGTSHQVLATKYEHVSGVTLWAVSTDEQKAG